MKHRHIVVLAMVAATAMMLALTASASTTTEVSGDTTLDADLEGNVVITSDDVTLDCAGHSISGVGHAGIDLTGRSGVTVINCDVVGFNFGVYLENSHGNTIKRSSSVDAVFHGFSVNYSTGNELIRNTATSPGDHGYVTNESDGNLFIRNLANGRGLQGFHVVLGSDNNTFSENRADGFGFGFGIGINPGSGNLFVKNAAINGDFGFLVDDAASGNTFVKNAACGNSVWDLADQNASENTYYKNKFCTTTGL